MTTDKLMAFRGEVTGFRYIVHGPRHKILFVHGPFCTGCNARTGKCGDLTETFGGKEIALDVTAEVIHMSMEKEVTS